MVLAGALLGHAAVRDGLRASGSNAYGAQARGGAARSEVVISSGPIAFPHVLRADVLVAMSQSAYDAFVDQTARPGGLVLYDASLVEERPREGLLQVPVSATETAVSDLGDKQAANLIVLGAAVARSGVLSREALEAAVEEHLPERFRELNLKALARGWEMGKIALCRGLG